MFFCRSIAVAAAALTMAASMAIERSSSPLSVVLKSVSNSEVEVTLTNHGAAALSLLKFGTILDNGPVRKLAVLHRDGSPVAFQGIHRNYLMSNLPTSAFVTLHPGATKTETIELASLHDLSAGGHYNVMTVGAIPLAKAGSTTLSGQSLSFQSNILSIHVDGASASQVTKAVKTLDKRTTIDAGCTGADGAALTTALANAAQLGQAASTAATSGDPAKFSEYYKSNSSTVKSTVAARFDGIVAQSGSASGTTYYCTDQFGDCSANVLAYTLPSQNIIANCPIYFSSLPALTNTCHAQDQATTTMHEFTHAPATFSPGTADNAYGYNAAMQLNSADAVLNADTYALYANAIYSGC